MIRINLSRDEAEIIRQISARRIRANRSADVVDRLVVNRDPLENEIYSLGAEVAVAKHYNLYWSPAWSPGSYEEDLKFTTGQTIDVKFTRGSAIWIQGHSPKSAYYIAVIGGPLTYDLRGWIPQRDALTDRFYKPEDERGPAAWKIPFQDLNQFPIYRF